MSANEAEPTERLVRGRPKIERTDDRHLEAREGIRDGERESVPQRLYRKRRTDDPMHIDPKLIPAGVSYQWCRESTFGMRDDDHIIDLKENHWVPVPADRHPELVVDGSPKDGVIRKRGSILMQRPKYLTDEAHAEDDYLAREAMNRALNKAVHGRPAGTLERDHPSVRDNTMIKRSYVPLD